MTLSFNSEFARSARGVYFREDDRQLHSYTQPCVYGSLQGELVVGNMLTAMQRSLPGLIGLKIAEQCSSRLGKDMHENSPPLTSCDRFWIPSVRCLQSCSGRCVGL